MTDIGKIKQEQQALELIEEKIKLVQNWLVKNYDNEHASKIRRDLSAYQVERQTRERVIQNLRSNLPSHGYEIQEVPENPTKNK